MAASFLVALVLGLELRPGGPGVAVRPSAPNGQAATGVASSVVPASPAKTALARNAAAAAATKGSRPSDATPWQMVKFNYPSGSDKSPRSFELPAKTSDQVDEAGLYNLPSAVSPELLKELKKQGHNVRQHRELVPLELQDGRWLVVPVDQVEIDGDKGPGL